MRGSTLKAFVATTSCIASVDTPLTATLLESIDAVALWPSVLSIPSFSNQRSPAAVLPMNPTAVPPGLLATGTTGGGSHVVF